MSSTEFDLDALAKGYEHRPPSMSATERAVRAARQSLDPLVDVGAGPGHHAASWARLGREAIALDVSSAMTSMARSHAHIHVARASAERLPFRNGSVGLAYFHLSIHYGSWRAMLSEADRVVRRGGSIVVWTFDPASIADSALARWFPSITAIDQPRFPQIMDLADTLARLGRKVDVAVEPEQVRRRAGDWVAAVRSGFVSSLQAVPTDELEHGIAEFRRIYPRDDDIYRYVIPYVSITSDGSALR